MNSEPNAHPSAAYGAGPPRLVVLAGPKVGQAFRVSGQVVIGRANSVEVVLDDGSVSRHHAQVLVTLEGKYIFEDLGSKNGSRINGKPTKHAQLEFGDEIQIGSRVVLSFQGPEFTDEQIAHRRRLEAVGRVSIGAAHDLNNMLGAISANVDFLAEIPCNNVEQKIEVEDCFRDIRVALAHATELTQGLLLFVRGRSRPHEAVDISSLCNDVLRLLRHTLDGTIRVEQSIAPGLVVLGDQAELHLVLMNLCLNARDAMPHGGTLRLSVELTSGASSVEPKSGSKSLIEIVVEDTGIGMDDATRARIFEPFFTTKPKGVGFGVGLASVLDVIEKHGGKVEVRSAPGAGAQFRLQLPALHGPEPKVLMSNEKGLGQLSETRGIRVLLVDDEDVVRRSVSRLLRSAGYEVLPARGGREALRIFESTHPRPDLVILDLDMPDLNGVQTERLLRAVEPSVHVLFLTGYDCDAHPNGAHLPSREGAYLRKPCAADVLLATVQRLLRSSADSWENNERTVTE